jgi:UMF1 family MFS transporter
MNLDLPSRQRDGFSFSHSVVFLLCAVKATLKEIRGLKHTFLFLTAYFLLSDGYSTVSSVGVLFATQELKADGVVLGIMLVEVPLFAFVGNWFWLWFKNKFDYSSKVMVGVTCFCMLILPTYSLLGFIPFVPFGLKHIWELFVFAGFYGFNVGAIQSFARTVYMALTPPGTSRVPLIFSSSTLTY